MGTVTCHTPDCENENIGIVLNLTDVDANTGRSKPVDLVVCGACGNEITDIQREDT